MFAVVFLRKTRGGGGWYLQARKAGMDRISGPAICAPVIDIRYPAGYHNQYPIPGVLLFNPLKFTTW